MVMGAVCHCSGTRGTAAPWGMQAQVHDNAQNIHVRSSHARVPVLSVPKGQSQTAAEGAQHNPPSNGGQLRATIRVTPTRHRQPNAVHQLTDSPGTRLWPGFASDRLTMHVVAMMSSCDAAKRASGPAAVCLSTSCMSSAADSGSACSSTWGVAVGEWAVCVGVG